MEELKRIILNKKYIIMLLLLLVINGVYVYTDNKADDEYSTEDTTLTEVYQQVIDLYKDMPFEEALADAEEKTAYYEELYNAVWDEYFEAMENGTYDDSMYTVSEDDLYRVAYSTVYNQLEYILGYGDYLDSIKLSAQKLKLQSALGDENTYSGSNIDKTVADFSRLEGVELSLDNEDALTAYADCFMTGFLIIVAAFVSVLIIMEERRKGLWQFTYVTSLGRKSLGAKRFFCIFAATAISGVLLELENLIILKLRYLSFGDLGRAIQSNMNFSKCVLTINVGEFICLVILLKILLGTVIGALLWLAAGSLKSHVAAFGIMILFVLAEYLCYANIDSRSSLNKLKYINVFSFLDSGNVLTSYQNVNFFENAVGVHTVLFILLPLLLVISCAAVTIMGGRKPFALKDGIFSRAYGRLIYKLKPYRHCSVFFGELYKVFIKQYALIVLILLALICARQSEKSEIFYDYETTMYNTYVNAIEGKVTQAKIDYLESELSVWQAKYDEVAINQQLYEELYEDYLENGDLSCYEIYASEREYESDKARMENYSLSAGVVSGLLETAYKLLGSENGSFVNKIGYEQYLGVAGNKESMMYTLIMLTFLIIATAGIKSYETSQNAVKFLGSMKRGRGVLFRRKLIVTAIITFIITLTCQISHYAYVSATYGISTLEASVKSLSVTESFPIDISLGAYIGIVWLLRFIMLYFAALIVMLISGRTKNMLISLVVSALVLLVPAGLVYMGFEALSVISVLRPVTVTYYFNQCGMDSVLAYLPLLAMAAVGAVCGYFSGKKYL